MDVPTLTKAMSDPQSDGTFLPRAGVNYAQYVAGCNQALALAGCTNINRAAMFLAQIGAESGGLKYTEELASGEEYNGRADLGNTQPGDGPRFKGRTFIQVTGRANYAALSAWAHSKGLVPSADYFVKYPEQLALAQFVWLGPVWYWGGQHVRDTTEWRYLNDAADARDVVGATYIINGGQNGIDGRIGRWNHCLSLGSAILPDGAESTDSNGAKPITPSSPGGFMPDLTEAEQREILTAARSWTKRLASIDKLLLAVTNGKGYVQVTLTALAKNVYTLTKRS